MAKYIYLPVAILFLPPLYLLSSLIKQDNVTVVGEETGAGLMAILPG